MQTSEQGLALIRQSEGFSAHVYLCPAGKNTIGYGHVIADGEQYPDSGISEQDAETLLIQDVNATEQAINRLVTITINQNQFDALVAFTYNIGAGAFEKSTLLQLLNAGDSAGAAEQFSRWVYCNGTVLQGLVTRRAAERVLFTG